MGVPYTRRRALTQHAISVSSEKHMQLEVNFNYSDLKAMNGRWILITSTKNVMCVEHAIMNRYQWRHRGILTEVCDYYMVATFIYHFCYMFVI